MGCTLDELGECMSSEEYSLRLYHREPFGQRTLLVLVAQLLAMTFNIHRGKDSQPMTVEDFLPSRIVPTEAPPAPTGFADVAAFLSEIGEQP